VAEIINLRNVRKLKRREETSVAAEVNRAKFGRTKSEKQRAKAETELASKSLDGHKRNK
jgi:Domain of unknown function (DUF4169)